MTYVVTRILLTYMTTNIKQTDNGMKVNMVGRPIDYNMHLKGNPFRVFAEFDVDSDGNMHVTEAFGEVKVNQFSTKVKKMRARDVHRVIRNASIKRKLTVN